MKLIGTIAVVLVFLTCAASPAFAGMDQNGIDKLPRRAVRVCVRWGVDPHHVADAVVVAPSGDAALDKSILSAVRAMNWDKPTGEYDGEWVGVTVGLQPQSRDPGVRQLSREELKRLFDRGATLRDPPDALHPSRFNSDGTWSEAGGDLPPVAEGYWDLHGDRLCVTLGQRTRCEALYLREGKYFLGPGPPDDPDPLRPIEIKPDAP